MANRKTFPHLTFNVKDETVRDVPVQNEDPLHIPLFLGFAEKGEGLHMGDKTELAEIFGDATFDMDSKFFKHPNLFCNTALNYQRVFFGRLIPTDAATPSSVLELKVKTDVQVTQYERDEFGGIVLDEEDNPVPKQEGGVDITEPGVELIWQIRPLAEGESYTGIQPETSMDGYTTYPMIVMTDVSPNAAGNYSGIKLWFDPEEVTRMTADSLGTVLYKAGFVERPYGYDNSQAIIDSFMSKSFDFSPMPDAKNPETDQRLTMEDIIINNYANNLPFKIHVYSDNFKIVGDTILGYETNETDIDSGWMVDVLTGTNLDGYPYYHVTFGSNSLYMDENVIHYMQGGSDGTITNDTLEELTREWLGGHTLPEIVDSDRYPITHIYDSGYSLDCKEALIDFHGVRKHGLKSYLSTQDVSRKWNGMAEDVSTGTTLRGKLLLHPDSLIFGTQMHRSTILGQAGYLSNSSWVKLVPATIDALIKNCMYMGATYYKGAPEGLPRSAVEIFREVNYFPAGDEAKQLLWNTGINYMQYYNRTSYHYADKRTIYPTENSVLSSDTFSNKITILYHLCARIWHKYAGLTTDPSLLYGDIENDIAQTVNETFSTHLTVVPRVYQTDVDKALGYQTSIEIAVYGDFPQRVFNFIIPVRRRES
jgi:hypothetical protein